MRCSKCGLQIPKGLNSASNAWRRSRDAAVPTQNLNPDILMMKSAEDWYRCDAADVLQAPKVRRILAQ
jgi:hypothetical protein